MQRRSTAAENECALAYAATVEFENVESTDSARNFQHNIPSELLSLRACEECRLWFLRQPAAARLLALRFVRLFRQHLSIAPEVMKFILISRNTGGSTVLLLALSHRGPKPFR
jgi:hypothetical protein